MAIVSISFTQIKAEKTGNVNGKININNNVMLTDVSSIDVKLGGGAQKGLLLKYKYTCDYAPKVGKILLEGDVVTVESDDVVKKVVDAWKKDKKVDSEISRKVLAQVLNKCTVQAIVLSRDLGLPAPIKLPSIGAGKSQ